MSNVIRGKGLHWLGWRSGAVPVGVRVCGDDPSALKVTHRVIYVWCF